MSVRIYQLARQLNLENKELMEILRKQGLDVKSPSSTIPNIYAENFIKEYQGARESSSSGCSIYRKSAKTFTGRSRSTSGSCPRKEGSCSCAGCFFCQERG